MTPQKSSQPIHVESQPTAADRADLPFADDGHAMAGEIGLLQRVKPLVQKYEENLQKRKVDIEFNLFAIISERYYQENLHSDILRALIDPKGKHQEKEKYLHLFLEFIRSHGAAVDLSEYSNAQVVREEGRVDLLIKDEVSKKAIIVENKINNAGDMPRQLPRYLEHVAKGYHCDAIIYLRLNGDTPPDKTGCPPWTPNDRTQVEPLLKVICAYDENKPGKDLLSGWIEPCEKVSENRDAQHILRQYGQLIKKLGGNVVNKPIMEKFYEAIVEGENFKTALSFKKMLDELIPYRVERIIDKFKGDAAPFRTAFSYQDGALFQDPSFGEPNLQMAVWVLPNASLFEFHVRNDPEDTKGQVKALLQQMGCRDDEYARNHDGFFTKEFEFPSQEEDLIRHIKDFKKKLRDWGERETLTMPGEKLLDADPGPTGGSTSIRTPAL